MTDPTPNREAAAYEPPAAPPLADTAADSSQAAPPVDSRPKPRYGEYAPLGPVAAGGQSRDQPRYGELAAPFAAPAESAAPMPQPPVVANPKAPALKWASLACWIVAVGLAILASFLEVSSGYTEQAVREIAPELAAQSADTFRLGTSLGMVTGSLIPLVPLAFAFVAWRGQGWARIAVSVLGGIKVVMGLTAAFALALPTTTGVLVTTTVLSVVSSLIVAVAIVLMYLPESNRFLQQVAAARRAVWSATAGWRG